ncbi:MAG: electron transfer flavoprotein subunit beta/FixA family protein [Planctomycetota bacterium]
MKIAVCLKLVPATTTDIRLAPDEQSLSLADAEMVVNPYDEYALEAALQIREKVADSTILAISVGGDEALKCLRIAFALGVDSAYHIQHPRLDTRAAARAAAALLKNIAPDLILCGCQAIDDNQCFFPGALAELLDIPHLTAVAALTITSNGRSLKCRRRLADGEQTLDCSLPAVIACDRGLNELRAPMLRNRLAARKKQPVIQTPVNLGLTDNDLAPALNVTRYMLSPQKTPGKIVAGSPAEAAKELVRLLTTMNSDQ